jgi:signal transduction histidine kinase/ligand-binding sensor domain-containing protein
MSIRTGDNTAAVTWRLFVVGLLCTVAAFADAGQPETTSPGRVLSPRRVTRQVPLVDGRDVQFRRLAADGLSRTRVTQITQDGQGFLWFGTQRGLYRYDGHDLQIFRDESGRDDTLRGVWVYSLLRDRAGALWIGSDGFVDRLDVRRETFTPHDLVPDGARSGPVNVSCMDQDASGVLWMGTRSGLYRVDPGSQRTVRFRHREADTSSLSSDVIQFVGEDRRGGLWVGTDVGLDLFDRASLQVMSHLPLAGSQRGLAFHEDRFGTFWVIHGAGGQLAVLDRMAQELSTWLPWSAEGGTNPVVFNTMLEDRDGVMWFGTLNHGLLKFDRAQQRFVRYTTDPADPRSLSDRRVNALFQDQEGLIWTGLHQSEPNFFLPRPPAFRAIGVSSGPSTLVSAILEDRSGLVWLGLDRGMRTLDRRTVTYRDIAALRDDETTSAVESEPGLLWIGTAGGGLVRYETRRGRVARFRHDPARSGGLPSDFVEQVKVDGHGSVWAVTWRGLARWDADAEQFVTYLPGGAPPELTLHTATFARSGVIWIGSNLGLHRYDPATGRVRWLRHDRNDPASLGNDRVNAILEGADGSVWVGTPSGLDRWDPDATQVRHYARSDGLSGSTVSCILEDNARQLWMSTDRGISRLDPATGAFKTYGAADGLPGVNMTGWDACARSASGEMFFAGFAGAVAFFPSGVADRDYVPPVVLTQFRLLDSTFDRDGRRSSTVPIGDLRELRLQPAQGKFSIAFAALSFLSPETNRLRYRLQGLQEEWTEVPGDQRVATYMALPAGSYTFQVQGATHLGPWSPSPASLRIVMLPPWWASRPFYLLAGAVATASLLIAYRVRVRQLSRAYNLRLEERWAERTRIARELHDTLLQSFQGLMFRLQAVRDLLPDRAEKALPVLDMALQQGERAIDDARLAVTDLRSAEKVDRDFGAGLAALATAAAHLAKELPVASFELVTSGRVREISPTVLHELYKVAHEALSNAFRHARATRIEAEMRFDADALRLTVTDDGVGFDEGVLANQRRRGHWGVKGMEERMDRLGGRMTVRSRPGEGTTVQFVVPAAVAFGDASIVDRIRTLVSWRMRSGES